MAKTRRELPSIRGSALPALSEVERASRVLVLVSHQNDLFINLTRREHRTFRRKVRDREDAISSTRDACATHELCVPCSLCSPRRITARHLKDDPRSLIRKRAR